MRLLVLYALVGQFWAMSAWAGPALDIHGLRPGMGGMEALGLAEEKAVGAVLRIGAVDPEILAGTAGRCAEAAGEEKAGCEAQREAEATYLASLTFVVDGETVTTEMTGPISGNRVFRIRRTVPGSAHVDLFASLVERFGEPEAILAQAAEVPVAGRWCETRSRCLEVGEDGVVQLYDAGIEAEDQTMRAKVRKALDAEAEG